MREPILMLLILLLATPAFCAGGEPEQVREERRVTVGGAEEIWRLYWADGAREACPPEEEESHYCPCRGFAYGEAGDLWLARVSGSKVVERLNLTPFFGGEELPVGGKGAVLARWPVEDGDSGVKDREALGKAVRMRPPVTALAIADYNRDGWAAEFPLQIGTEPCGKRITILVGLTPAKPRLHSFRTPDYPGRTLTLYRSNWEEMLASPAPWTFLETTCGDHGAEEEDEISVTLENGQFSAVRRTYGCVENFKRGKLLRAQKI